ncbi:MAG: radical SAM protein [Vampirovibrionales bacterium]
MISLANRLQQPLDEVFVQTRLLPKVFKPARYLGIEHGAYRKPLQATTAQMCLVFPDLYEIGASSYGQKLLYSVVNNHPDYLCDRAYAPAHDMRDALKAEGVSLFGIETLLPLAQFDMLAFSLQYELNYTTILGILEAANIAFRAENRPDWSTPLIIAGGPGTGNPFPLAPFFDAFIIGDGEEVLIELMDLLAQAKAEGWDKPMTRRQLARVEGVFVPGISTHARKRIVDITQRHDQVAPLIPYIQTVHDRTVVEARRGCDRMCRFCQPCFINLPVREQSVDKIRNQALSDLLQTGYEECSLLSLSIADYTDLKPLIFEVADALAGAGASLSLPSQRADRFSVDIADAVQQVRKSTLTFAPEAGTERLRAVINKNLSEQEIMHAVTSAYEAGWNKVKLYFMMGLPTERDEDLQGIADLVRKMQAACRDIKRDPAKSLKKNLKSTLPCPTLCPKATRPSSGVPRIPARSWFASAFISSRALPASRSQAEFYGSRHQQARMPHQQRR